MSYTIGHFYWQNFPYLYLPTYYLTHWIQENWMICHEKIWSQDEWQESLVMGNCYQVLGDGDISTQLISPGVRMTLQAFSERLIYKLQQGLN